MLHIARSMVAFVRCPRVSLHEGDRSAQRSTGRQGKGGATVQLRFELGDPQTPRGHAILYARGAGPTGQLMATYCVVLPISFSIGKYLPPMFAAQMPMEALQESTTMSVVPIPPMLEDVTSFEELRQIAQRRDDDLCDVGAVLVTDDSQRMTFAAEAAAAYGQLYGAYLRTWPDVATAAPPEDLNVEDVLAEVLSDRDRLAELARGVGMLRYAMEGKDRQLLGQTEQSMRRMAAGLPEKYRADRLIEAALRPDEHGDRLAQLYLQRAYKLVEEDYTAIPPLEREIRELED
jgi:transposase